MLIDINRLYLGHDATPDFQVASLIQDGSAPHPLPLPGPITQDTYQGTSGNDHFEGTSDGDYFFLQDGGNDEVNGRPGNNRFYFGASYTPFGDYVVGGYGYDTVVLEGDYSVFLPPNEGVYYGFFEIEEIDVIGNHNYALTPDDTDVDAGQWMTLDSTSLGAGYSFTWDGNPETDGHFKLYGGAGTDIFTGGYQDDIAYGGGGNDIFGMYRGGNDQVYAGDGNDSMRFYDQLTAADTINGGAGSDELTLQGDYTGARAVSFSPTTVTNVEQIVFAAGYSYSIASNDATVAAGTVLELYGSTLGPGDSLTFDGSAETDGQLVLYGGAGGAGQDTFTGGSYDDIAYGGGGNDIFAMDRGGNDQVFAGDGDDTIRFDGALTAADKIDGGAGIDTLTLNGDYTGARALSFSATTVVNVERIQLAGGHSYSIATNDATVAAGRLLFVDGSFLSGGDTLTFDGSAETDGQLVLYGGAGQDVFTGGYYDDIAYGGGGKDRLTGGAGRDTLIGGGGKDRFIYGAAADSTGPNYDTVQKANFAADRWDVPGTITGINAAITHGALATGSHFDVKLAAAVDAAHLGAHHAVVFTPDSGTLAGKTFLIVDVNGVAGYQTGADLVVLLATPQHLASLDAGDFI